MAASSRASRPEGVQERLLAAGSPRVIKVLVASVAALKAQGARFCLVGGLARAFLAEARSTRDVDFAVSVGSEAAADEVIRQMQGAGFLVRSIFQRDDGALATARLTLGEIPTRCDLLFSTSGLERLVVEAAVSRELTSGMQAPVIIRQHLIAMKLVAARAQDLIDIEALLDAATPAEVKAVPKALSGLVPEKREKANAAWTELLAKRRARKPDLFPAPERLRALQRPPRRRK
jgi:hypothetical protein